MYPWLLFWAPQLHFPFGGDLAQRIQPNTNWFFDSIPSKAGDGEIERRAFEIASYGRQLGWITEVLLGVAEQSPPSTVEGQDALKSLRDIEKKIEDLKHDDAMSLTLDVERLIHRLQIKHKGEFPAIRQRLEAVLATPVPEKPAALDG